MRTLLSSLLKAYSRRMISDLIIKNKKTRSRHSQFELHLILLLSEWLFLWDGNELLITVYFWLSCTWHFNETCECVQYFIFIFSEYKCTRWHSILNVLLLYACWLLRSHSKERKCEKKVKGMSFPPTPVDFSIYFSA